MELDEPLRPALSGVAALVKEDLEALSVEELQERISLLKAEIARAEQMVESKHSSYDSAEDVFR